MPRDSILDEKSKKGSTYRFPSEEGSKASDIFLFGQSMLIISDLMTTQLLLVHEVDPIRRYLPSATRPKTGGRYSSFEVSSRITRICASSFAGAAEPGWSGVVGPPLELGIYKVNSGISVCPAPFIVFGPPLDKIRSFGPAFDFAQ